MSYRPTAIITGGSQGSGFALAKLLLSKNYNVCIAARRPDVLQASESRLREAIVEQKLEPDLGSAAARILAVPTDITNPADVANLRQQVLDKYDENSVNLLANVAGVCLTGPFGATKIEDFRAQLDVNFLGAVQVTHAFLPALERNSRTSSAQRTTIAVVNSSGGRLPLNNMTAYTASKFALAGWADALRYEMAKENIHVCQIQPGVINSDFLERAQFVGEQATVARSNLEKILASGMAQTPEEVAEAVWQGVASGKEEVVVGAAFQAAITAYKWTGLNVFGVDAPSL